MHHLALQVFFTLLILLAGSAVQAQTIRIVTHQGEIYVGERLAESSDTVAIRSDAGVAVAVPRASISLIDYAHRPNDATRDEKREGYWMFGLTYGTPGLVNIVVGRHFTRSVGLRVSAGAWDDFSGLAFDGVFRLASTGPVDHLLIAGMGTLEIASGFDEWTYFQGGYNINVYGFNAFLALSAGWGSFDSPQPTFQVGYVHRFVDR